VYTAIHEDFEGAGNAVMASLIVLHQPDKLDNTALYSHTKHSTSLVSTHTFIFSLIIQAGTKSAATGKIVPRHC
jgi:hypothetical protein